MKSKSFMQYNRLQKNISFEQSNQLDISKYLFIIVCVDYSALYRRVYNVIFTWLLWFHKAIHKSSQRNNKKR